MADYAVMVTTDSEAILLDAVENFQIMFDNEMTTHPMVNGDIVGDHIIVHPCTISFSGAISMNSSSPIKSLSGIQKQFERIKDDGILCTVAKVKTINNEFRFLKRNCMALTGIVWTEKINSLDFTFTFKQALIDNVQSIQVAEANSLPDIVNPGKGTFIGTLMSEEALYYEILDALQKTGIVSTEFLTQALAYGSWAAVCGVFAYGAALSASAAYAAATATGIAAAAGAAGGASMVPVVGWIAAGVIALGIGVFLLATCITEAIEASKLRYKVFNYDFDDYEEEKEEMNRFTSMMSQIKMHVDKVNEWFKCYSFETNEPREYMFNVAGTYHVFTFTRNNVSSAWKCRITYFDGEGEKEVCSKDMTFVENVGQLSKKDAFCTLQSSNSEETSERYVYFVGNGNLEESYMMIASKDPSKFSSELTKVIMDAITV